MNRPPTGVRTHEMAVRGVRGVVALLVTAPGATAPAVQTSGAHPAMSVASTLSAEKVG